MNTKAPPTEIATSLLSRSKCHVQCAAVLADKEGQILGWGWNSCGPTGFGMHAEAHAIQRTNRNRLKGATIYVCASRGHNHRNVFAKPCEACSKLLKGIKVVFRNKEGIWQTLS